MLTSAKTRNRWLLWSENVETKPDKEGFSDLLPTFDDHAHEPMAGSSELIFPFEKDSKKF